MQELKQLIELAMPQSMQQHFRLMADGSPPRATTIKSYYEGDSGTPRFSAYPYWNTSYRAYRKDCP